MASRPSRFLDPLDPDDEITSDVPDFRDSGDGETVVGVRAQAENLSAQVNTLKEVVKVLAKRIIKLEEGRKSPTQSTDGGYF